MVDGYYLSTYLFINKLAHLTNIPLRHDQNISLWKKRGMKIELIRYWELERVTGLKHHELAFFDEQQAVQVINQLLEEFNLTIHDMKGVWGTPQLATGEDYHSLSDYSEFSYHSLCHLFSSLFLDSELFYSEDIIALAVDGAPDNVVDLNIDNKYYYSGCFSKKGEIIDIFPAYSPGLLWANAGDYYNLREGTLMALANATTSEMIGESPLSRIWVKGINDVSEIVDDINLLFNYVNGFTEKDAGILFNHYDERFTEQENKISMVMKEIQAKSLDIMERNINDIVSKYNVDTTKTYLALSGGYNLNCPSNAHIMKKFNFKGFIAPPCINDAGLSLGIALYAFYKNMKESRIEFKFESPYYGNADDSLDSIIEKYSEFIAGISDLNSDEFIEDLVKSPIAWFNGASEIGPRALGNRSLLADPRDLKAKKILNEIKQREWWRPVAPIIMEEDMGTWFEQSYSSPYMLHSFLLKENKRDVVPAIMHLDGSARVQTITEQTNPLLYGLLAHFKKNYGIPIICNTSLNDRDEPIIDTIEELMNFVLRKGLKIAYINGKRVSIINHEYYKEDRVYPRKIQFEDYLSEGDKQDLLKELNPHNISLDSLKVYIENPRLYSQINIQNKIGVRLLESITKVRENRFHRL
jgi:carbamoyltransferase